MAVKIIDIPEIGEVSFQQHRNSRSIRIHINGSKVKVTYPYSVPLMLAKQYLQSKKTWILTHKKQSQIFSSGDLIGKTHKLIIHQTSNSSIRSKITKDEIQVFIPETEKLDSSKIQDFISKKVESVLKTQSEELVTARLSDIAFENGLEYRSVLYKKLKRRWGSCDSKKNLVFNIYLVQLPWELIDYVIAHELAHTKQMNHSIDFWKEVSTINPGFKINRKELKGHPPESIVH